MLIGADFGTNNSCIAFSDGTRTQVIPWPDKGRTAPSVVLMPENLNDKILVGRTAVAEGKSRWRYCFKGVKRLFGQKATGAESPDGQVVAVDGQAWLRGPQHDFSPSEVASWVINEMLVCAEHRLNGHRPEGGVFTHPAYYGDSEKAALIEAVKLTGILQENIHLLAEPSAAAFAYQLEKDPIRFAVVYDWGAGTIDVSILHAGRGVIDPRWFDGAPIGGMDVDEEIALWLKKGYYDLYGVDLGEDHEAMVRLRAAAEEAKIALSTQDSYRIDIPLIQTVPPRSLNATLTQEELERLAKPLINKTLEICLRAMEKAGLTTGNIADLILVGGMTNMPCVRRALEQFFGRSARNDVDPDEVVAIGAATYAAMIERRMKPAKLMTRAAQDFGVELVGDVFLKVIPKGTPYPLKEQVLVPICTDEDGQEEISIHVIEGPHFMASQSTRLAAADFQVPPEPKHAQRVDLYFDIDENGMTTVTGPVGVIYQGAPNG